jgi:hypothetical protein
MRLDTVDVTVEAALVMVSMMNEVMCVGWGAIIKKGISELGGCS